MPKRRRYPLKDKESKKLLLEASKLLGTNIEQFIDSKPRIEVNETETADIFIFNGRPLLANSEGTLFFTLSFKELFPSFPKIVVDMGAVPYVCKGADVMAPGVREVKGEFKANDLLFVVDERHGKPLAVGVALFSSEEMKTVTRGKTIKNLHYVGDKLWDYLRSS
ncbi:MAG: RNA-binding protein [Candidatus Bathyarchaeota archaeon]|nr:RNA-binding protein [Candidatus Bathyarchaeum sp.]